MNINDLTSEELYALRVALQHRINAWSGKAAARDGRGERRALAEVEKLRKLQQKLMP